jgi:putative membrane protein
MRYSSFCKINLEALFRIIILLGYCILFLVMALTKRISIYLHPRLIPYVIFAAMAFLLMAYSLLGDFRRTRRRLSVIPYLIFLLPLILALTVPANAMGGATLQLTDSENAGISAGLDDISGDPSNLAQSSEAINGGSAVQQGTSPSPAADNGGTLEGAQAPPSGTDGGLQLQPNQKAVCSKTPFGSTVVLIITDNTITIDDKNFVNWISELDNNPGEYVGMTLELVGYVYKSGEFESDEFVVGRNMMWCCAADIQMIGCLCRYGKADELEEYCWVRVAGTLSTATWQGASIPYVVDATVTPARAPAVEYVYPIY